MKTIEIKLGHHYPIYLAEGLLNRAQLAHYCKVIPKRFVIITDSHLQYTHAKTVHDYLLQYGVMTEILVMQAGETYKTRETKEMLENNLLAKNYGRDTCLLAVGGGVVSDMTGFLAATYCRGIDVIYVPTTLLAMVDASIGGKTGVNTPHGKNLIGCVYQPRAVFIDTAMLETLPEREFRSGMVEIIKHSIIADADFFRQLQHHRSSILEMIYTSCLIKKNIVEQDERDNNIRQLLNFGHTIGHALEAIEDYQIAHGEAVAIGMLVEAQLAKRLGYLNESAFTALFELLHMHNLPLKSQAFRNKNVLLQQLKGDKKNIADQIRFVMLADIGRANVEKNNYTMTVPTEILHETIVWAADCFSA